MTRLLVLTEKKKCSRCGEKKKIDEFSRQSSHKDGLCTHCKECNKLLNKGNYKKCLSAIKVTQKNYREKFPEKVKSIEKKWRKKNYKKYCETQSKWRKNNPEKLKSIRKKADTRKRSTPRGKLSCNVSSAIGRSLYGTKDGHRWESLVGYMVGELKIHLEKLFQPDMNWENYGKWHVDHKIPISAFNFEKPEDIDFKKCWALSNLQPLWALENFSKHDNLTEPFQPSLLITL